MTELLKEETEEALKEKLSKFRKNEKFIERDLPRTLHEFEGFADYLIALYDFPPGDSYKHAIATMIMHLDPLQTTATFDYFARSIIKSICNDVAFTKIQEYNEAMKKKRESEAEAKAKDVIDG